MAKNKLHYSKNEKANILIENVPYCRTLEEAEPLARLLDSYTFDMLRGLAKALTIIMKGK
jgi:hypothetical protein